MPTGYVTRRLRTSLGALALAGVALLGVSGPAAPSAVAAPHPQLQSVRTLDAQLTPDQMFARAAVWLTANNGGPVPYSQTSYWTDGYRQDCSGYVSMALGLATPGLNTVGLASDRSVTTPTTLGQLSPGDLLIDADGSSTTRHVVIFEYWTDSSHSAYMAYEQRGGHGTDHRVLTYGLDAGSEYKPYHPVALG